jgi:putative hydrolase of the HAD superfamily
MKGPDAIFFDMDGTILDSQTGREESWLAACEAHCDGLFAPARMHAAIRARLAWFLDDVERSSIAQLDPDAANREIVRHAFTDLGLYGADVADRIVADYRAQRTAAIAPYPGAIETLETLRARGTRMALLTNGGSASQRRSIERFGLERYFDPIVIEGEFGAGKPDERVFRHALSATGCDPERAWMVGDDLEADIAPAVRLGLHAVWISGDGAAPPDGVRPHRVVRSIAELL